MKRIILLLVLVLLVSVSFQDTITTTAKEASKPLADNFENPDAWCEVSKAYGLDLMVPAIITGMLMLFVTAIVYQFGKVLSSQKITDTAMNSFFDIGITIALTAIILFSIIAANTGYSPSGLAVGEPGQQKQDIIDAAMEFSYFIVTKIGTDLSVFILFNNFIQFYATSTLYFGSFHYTISVSPGLALKPLGDVLGLLIQVLSVALAEWMFHLIALCFIKKWTFTVFIPLAMILRVIPYTRDGGAALLSLVFCLSLVYPMMFIVQQEVYNLTYTGWEFGQFMDVLGSFGMFNAGVMAFGLMIVAQSMFISLVIYALTDFVYVMAKEAIYMFVLMSLFLPFINIMVTLTAAKEFAKSFHGVDVNFASIVRII